MVSLLQNLTRSKSGLLISVVVLAVLSLLLALGLPYLELAERHRFIQEVKASKGEVQFDWRVRRPLAFLPHLTLPPDSELRVEIYSVIAKDPSPALVDWLLHLDEIENLDIRRPKGFGDDQLRILKQKPRLLGFSITQAEITDEGLKHLAVHHGLDELRLNGCKRLRGDGLGRLSGLDQIELISLAGSPIEDAAIRHINAFPKLSVLDLTATNVTDEGILQLARVAELRILSLKATRVTDAIIPQLARMTALGRLSIARTQLTDAALEVLAGNHDLTGVVVSGSILTDRGIDALEYLPNLRYLGIHEGLPDRVKQEIRARYPDVRVAESIQTLAGIRNGTYSW